MTKKRKVYVFFEKNNQKCYIAKLTRNREDKIIRCSYTPDKTRALILDEGTVWYRACQNGMDNTPFFFEDVEFAIINPKKDVP